MDIDAVLQVEEQYSTLTRRKSMRESERDSLNSETSIKPKDVRGFFNITTTTNRTISDIQEEIERVLIQNGLEFTKDDKTLRYNATSRNKNTYTFEVQIMSLSDDDQSSYAIQFKRLKGSLWYHKKFAGRLIQEMAL
jgi:hypothetical protein